MAVQCLSCANFTLAPPAGATDKAQRAAEAMHNAGMSSCAVHPSWVFLGPTKPRECPWHEPAGPAYIPARIAWLESLP